MTPRTFAWRADDGLVHRTWSINARDRATRRPTLCDPTTFLHPHKSIVEHDAVVTCVWCAVGAYH